MKKILLLFLLLTVTVFAQKKVITVTIEPQKFILEKLVKNSMNIKTVFKGSNFDIRFKKLAYKNIAASDLYITIGLDEIEKTLIEQTKLYNKDLDIFDMSKDIYKMDNNPYVWMDPLNVRQLAKTLFFKLSDMDPKNREFYLANYETFIEELNNLYVKIKLNFQQSFFGVVAFDDYWDYYLARFDFHYYKQKKAVLNAHEISDFIHSSKKRNLKILLIHPKTSIRVSKSVATNANAKILESDIFQYSFMGDMLVLAKKMAK